MSDNQPLIKVNQIKLMSFSKIGILFVLLWKLIYF